MRVSVGIRHSDYASTTIRITLITDAKLQVDRYHTVIETDPKSVDKTLMQVMRKIPSCYILSPQAKMFTIPQVQT